MLANHRYKIAVVCLTVLTGLVGLVSGAMTRAPHFDEPWILRATAGFEDDLTWRFIRTYDGNPNSSGPLYLLVNILWCRLFGLTSVSLRFLSLFASAMAVVTIALLARRLGLRRAWWLPSCVALFGYNFLLSFTAMTELPVLASSTLGLWCFLVGFERRRPLFYALAAGCWMYSVDAKLLSICWPVACGIFLVLRDRRNADGWMAVCAPLLVHAPLYVAWGGMLPPTQHLAFPNGISVRAGFHPTFLNHGAVLTGIFFWPLALAKLPYLRDRVPKLLLAIVAAGYLIWPPDYAGFEHLGMVRTGLVQLGLQPWGALVCVFPWAAGCVVLGTVLAAGAHRMRKGRPAPALLTLVVACNFAFLAVTPVAWDRYFVPALAMTYLLCLKEARNERWVTALLVLNNALLAGLYFGWHF